MHDLAGPADRGQERVIAQHLRVAVAGALFGLSGDFTDRGIDINHHTCGLHPSGPCPLHRHVVDRFCVGGHAPS